MKLQLRKLLPDYSRVSTPMKDHLSTEEKYSMFSHKSIIQYSII